MKVKPRRKRHVWKRYDLPNKLPEAGVAVCRKPDITLRENIDGQIAQAEKHVESLKATRDRMEKSGILDMRIDDIQAAMALVGAAMFRTFSIEQEIRRATDRYRAENSLPPACEICGHYSCRCNDEPRDNVVPISNHGNGADWSMP